MKKEREIKYKTRTLTAVIQATKDPDDVYNVKTKVNAPQFTESTYDGGFVVLRELGTTAYSVYMAILSYRNVKTNDCHPSIKRISEDFNMSQRTIKDNIDKLYEAGVLEVNSGHKNIANNYFFPLEYFHIVWAEDYRQKNAQRRTNGISEKRRTKAEILAENEMLKQQLAEATKKGFGNGIETNSDSNDENSDKDQMPF